MEFLQFFLRVSFFLLIDKSFFFVGFHGDYCLLLLSGGPPSFHWTDHQCGEHCSFISTVQNLGHGESFCFYYLKDVNIFRFIFRTKFKT